MTAKPNITRKSCWKKWPKSKLKANKWKDNCLQNVYSQWNSNRNWNNRPIIYAGSTNFLWRTSNNNCRSKLSKLNKKNMRKLSKSKRSTRKWKNFKGNMSCWPVKCSLLIKWWTSPPKCINDTATLSKSDIKFSVSQPNWWITFH